MDTQNSTQTNPAEPPPASECNWSGYFMRAILWFFAALLCYCLATGPAIWLEIKYPATKHAVDTVYAPLGHICDRYPAIAHAFLWYISAVWRVPIPPGVY